MLRDPERLRAILTNPDRPVQLVIAGKAHPADDGGKALIQQVVRFTEDPELRDRMIFLPDYDISMARHIYAGCDVWLNNPVRPLEACGTSGMKSALNGGLNPSILDGWWDEMADRGERVGHRFGRGDRRAPPRRSRGAGTLRAARESVIPLFTAVTTTASRSVGWRWCGIRSPNSARRCWPHAWSATTRPRCTHRRPPRSS